MTDEMPVGTEKDSSKKSVEVDFESGDRFIVVIDVFWRRLCV